MSDECNIFYEIILDCSCSEDFAKCTKVGDKMISFNVAINQKPTNTIEPKSILKKPGENTNSKIKKVRIAINDQIIQLDRRRKRRLTDEDVRNINIILGLNGK